MNKIQLICRLKIENGQNWSKNWSQVTFMIEFDLFDQFWLNLIYFRSLSKFTIKSGHNVINFIATMQILMIKLDKKFWFKVDPNSIPVKILALVWFNCLGLAFWKWFRAIWMTNISDKEIKKFTFKKIEKFTCLNKKLFCSQNCSHTILSGLKNLSRIPCV